MKLASEGVTGTAKSYFKELTVPCFRCKTVKGSFAIFGDTICSYYLVCLSTCTFESFSVTALEPGKQTPNEICGTPDHSLANNGSATLAKIHVQKCFFYWSISSSFHTLCLLSKFYLCELFTTFLNNFQQFVIRQLYTAISQSNNYTRTLQLHR